MWNDVMADVIAKTLTGFREELASFGPRLLAMLAILAVGAVAAGVVRLLVSLLIPRMGFDRFAERAGVSGALRRGGIAGLPSNVLAVVLSWSVFGVFVLLAIGALNLQYARDLLSRAFVYLPQVLIAAAVLVLGLMIADFLRRSVLIAAVNAGLPSARLLAALVHTFLVVLFSAMALEHLGVGRQVILISFTILFGGVVFALALAFGLAGRDLAGLALERLARRREEEGQDELKHL